MMKPDALAAICHKIEKDWGVSGYAISSVVTGPLVGSAVAEVWSSDGAVFYVAADRYGNTTNGHDTLEEARDALRVSAS
jgi:hypothetical protein